MKTKPCFSALLLAATVALAEPNEQSIQRVMLDERAASPLPHADTQTEAIWSHPLAIVN